MEDYWSFYTNNENVVYNESWESTFLAMRDGDGHGNGFGGGFILVGRSTGNGWGSGFVKGWNSSYADRYYADFCRLGAYGASIAERVAFVLKWR
jgi:hypothetical protein